MNDMLANRVMRMKVYVGFTDVSDRTVIVAVNAQLLRRTAV